jgi:hypothetical protein
MERIVPVMTTKKFDITVLLFGFILLLYGTYQLNHLKFENEIAKLTVPIAVIQLSANTVKKKSSHQIGWMDVWQGDPLFNHDQIFTFDDSNAMLKFIDGPSIEVSEKTLFKVQLSEGILNLDLTEGSVIAKINSNTGLFRVSIKGKIYQLDSAKAKIRLSRKSDLDRIHIIEGEVQIASNQQILKVQKNQKIELNSSSLNKSKVLDVPDNQVSLDIPKLNKLAEKYNFYNQQHAPQLSWDAISGAKSYKIEVSLVSSGKIVHQDTILATEFKMPILSGDYNVRLASVDSDGLVHQFSQEKPLSIRYGTWDVLHGSVKIELKKPDQLVEFNWGDENQMGKYEFELSSRPDFREILTKRQLQITSTKISFPTQGSFYWRAKEILSNGNTLYRKPIKVIVSPSPPPVKPILKKELRLKVKKVRTSSNWFIDILISTALADDFYVEIPLPTGQDIKSYLIEIFNDAKGEQLLLKGTSSKETFRIHNPQVGQFYYRVAIKDFWGRQGPFSEMSKVILEQPEVKKEITSNKITLLSPHHHDKFSTKTLNFKWFSQSTENYTLQISLDVSFSKFFFEKKVKSKSLMLSEKKLPSHFYWRVIQGKTESLRRIFTLIKKPITKRPIKIVSKKPEARRVARNLNQREFWIAYKPSVTNYKSTLSRQSILIDGIVLYGLQVGWSSGEISKSRKKRFYQIQFTRSSGKVFETLKYHNQKLRLSFGDIYFELPFSLKFNLGASDISHYEITNSTLSERSKFLFHTGLGLLFPFYVFNLSFESFLNYGMGTSTIIDAGLNNYYHLSKSYKLFIGVSYESEEFKIEGIKNRLNQTSAIFGITKLF